MTAAKLTQFLDWITPQPGLETLETAAPAVRERLEAVPWARAGEMEAADEALRRLERGEPLAPEHDSALEAIVLPNERPIVDVVDGTYDAPIAPFQHYGDAAARATIEAAIPSVGRIELPNHEFLPYAGTGFVVGTDLLMTNRHVAELFATGLGRAGLAFQPGRSAAVDFLHEVDRDASREFRVTRVVMVHPYWDMALLATEGLGDVPALRLSVEDPGDLNNRDVAVIGYPALDTRNDIELQNRIFRRTFNVKRMQPGLLRPRARIDSFGHDVSAVTHDSSTLGGNSGSAVIDVATGAAVALHFAGIYLKANYAVPTRELARDRRVVEAGVNFEGGVADTGPAPWERFWDEAEGRPVVDAGFPIEVTVQIRRAGDPPVARVEALAEPFRDEDFSTRRGYDKRFLGVDVPLPRVRDTRVVSRLDDGSYLLRYEHFSAVQHKERRLALYTAANVDATPDRKVPEPGRDYTRRGLTGLRDDDQEKWFTDPRIPAIHQLPDRFFTKDRAAFDKGHIVRREDVAWGDTYDELRRANGDTFHVTNCSPQVARFNRSALKGVWGQLENLILAQAKTERYCVLAGPVLRDDDPVFRGVDAQGPVGIRVPRRFWKIVVARSAGQLQAFAFVLEQDLSRTPLEFAVDALWRSRMIAIPQLEELTRLIAFPRALHRSDQFDAPAGEAIRAHPAIDRFD